MYGVMFDKVQQVFLALPDTEEWLTLRSSSQNAVRNNMIDYIKVIWKWERALYRGIFGSEWAMPDQSLPLGPGRKAAEFISEEAYWRILTSAHSTAPEYPGLDNFMAYHDAISYLATKYRWWDECEVRPSR